MANYYTVGALVRCWCTFQDSSSNNQDPTNVFFRYVDTAGSTTSLTYGGTGPSTRVVKDATGIFYCDVDADATGTFSYKWWATGTGQSAAEDAFHADEERTA